MALVKCPDCGNMISEYAPSCIGCGRPMTHNHSELQASTIRSSSSEEIFQDNIERQSPAIQTNDNSEANTNPLTIGMKWFRFWVYFCLPFSAVATTLGLIVIGIDMRKYVHRDDTVFATVMLGLVGLQAIIPLFIFYGLFHKRLWGWWLNCICLVVISSLWSISGIDNYVGHPWFLWLLFGSLLVIWITWIIPNLIYWRKRKFLFVKHIQ